MVITTVKTICIACLVLVLAGFANASSEDPIRNKFMSLQKAYFLKLDLRAPAQELLTIPKFSSVLDTLADEQREVLKANKSLSTTDKELAGLVLIYDAMLNSNNIIGILNGRLSLTDFTNEKIFSKRDATQREELIARAARNISELKLAATLRPDDRRIDGWIIGTKAIADTIEYGHPSKATQSAIIKAIGVRPSFNLWTAILVLHNEPQASKQALVKSAKNFVEATKEGKDPCTLHPADCASTWKAPYNYQASVTVLGDVFLQQAEYELLKNNIKNAMIMAGYADGTYQQLTGKSHIKNTKQWPDNYVLSMREASLNEIKNKKTPKNISALKDYQQPYECASCHGRVTN